MFKFDNTHIFTGYLKQLLSSVNLPTCRIYTKEYADYFKQHGKEDPRVIESFDTITYTRQGTTASKQRIATSINYLKANELYQYLWEYSQNSAELGHRKTTWRRASSAFYSCDKNIPGLTKILSSSGGQYDTVTHEHLGDYLRFMRDYYGINLMSLYNCFNNKICNNIYYKHSKKLTNTAFNANEPETAANVKYLDSYSVFDSQDSNYRIYAFPVKLFSDYTIAIDCSQGLELFCGLYTTTLETTSKGIDLISKTYKKINKAIFNQPFLYNALNVEFWNFADDTALVDVAKSTNQYPRFVTGANITRWDIANREQDLKLFIKVPTSCRSSIVVLEGDFRGFNDTRYAPVKRVKQNGDKTIEQTSLEYQQNHSVINFGDAEDRQNGLDINKSPFKPISKIQLLAFNTGESYPFADRLVEYLSNSAITPIDEIADNIKRTQKVMSQNQHYFKIDGLWENKMQKILYDYMVTSGPIKVENKKLEDKRVGYHPRLGHSSKSTLYDVLGYVDRDAEKWYASWVNKNNEATMRDNIQNVDIYNGLYDV